MSDRISLSQCAIVVDDEPAYVLQGVEDLRTYIEAITGISPPIRSSTSQSGDASILILIGKAGLDAMDQTIPSHPQGYAISVHPGQPSVIRAGGRDPQGTKFALVDLARAVQVDGDEAWLPGDLRISDAPHYGLRGMYGHLHWQYNNPYALRSWSLDEWKRYIDLLAQMKVNLFQIWTMAAICPTPLSPGDEAYLCKYRDVVQYAREMRGMEVWPGECANNIAESDFGAPIEKREYFQVEVLKNPADPSQFRQIMENRANMYRLVNNGDGYWIIDSDPGGYPDSPSSDLADIFAGNRELADKLAEKNGDTKLVYWMWWGWGTGNQEENWRSTLQGMRDKVREPWWIDACNEKHLDLVSEMAFEEKTVFFPYGAVEPEPSNPFTHVWFEQLSELFDLALRHPGLAGAMANAQTPLAQLPNIFYFIESAWDPDLRDLPREEILFRLGHLLFPEIARELADGWNRLDMPGSDAAFDMSRRLISIVEKGRAGVPGPGGRFIFPRPELVIEDLALMLRIHGGAELVRETIDGDGSDKAIQDALYAYLSAVLEWQSRTGFHGCRVDGEDFRGGGTLLYGKDCNLVLSSLSGFYSKPENRDKNELWFRAMETRLRDAGFGGFMSERAAFEGVFRPGSTQ